MMLYIEDDTKFRLKLIDKYNIDELRKWKNLNKEFFFLKEDITSKQQLKWFDEYKLDKENFMFIIQELNNNNYINIGCMGFRIEDNIIDVYNIIRGERIENSTYAISSALTIMNNFIFDTFKYDITCKVLKDNIARSWYEKLYFENTKEVKDYILYKLNTNKMEKLKIKKDNK